MFVGWEMRVLIAERDAAMSALLQRSLFTELDDVELASDAETALELLIRREPDLLLLDGAVALEAPHGAVSSMLTMVRQLAPACLVLMLLDQSESRAGCLEDGADDCMVRPLSLRELRARCHAMLRRQQALRQVAVETATERGPLTLHVGGLAMQRTRRQADWNGTPLHLTRREFGLLEQLMLVPGATVERGTLRLAMWEGKTVETNALEVHMVALRRKLSLHEGAPTIETVRGVGYRLGRENGWNKAGLSWSLSGDRVDSNTACIMA